MKAYGYITSKVEYFEVDSMCGNQTKKKEHEHRLFVEVLNIARRRGGEARRNADRLDGDIRGIERPDLLIEVAHDHVIGIEHYRVDQYVSHGKKRTSKAAEFVAQFEADKQTCLPSATDGIITEDMTKAFGNYVSQATRMWHNSCLSDLLNSFDMRTFDEQRGHIHKLDEYRSNLKILRPDAKVETGFLIEVHSDFQSLIMRDIKGPRRVHYGELPLFAEIYARLKEVSKQVDWLILAYCGAIDDKVRDAVVARCSHGVFQKSLERQSIIPVEYLGLGKTAPTHYQKKPGALKSVNRVANRIDIVIDNTTEEIDSALLFDSTCSGAARAANLVRAGIPFVATFAVEMMYEVVADYARLLSKQLDSNDILRILHNLGYEAVNRRMDKVYHEWNLDKVSDGKTNTVSLIDGFGAGLQGNAGVD